jgi:mannosylfructose-phosphate synthase
MHILMITNHGLHAWKVIPGLPDTGGQNVFVNEMSAALARLGHEVTIINRGGFPDPVSGEMRRGVHHKDDKQRILYLDDGLPEFVRKEDMDSRIPFLVESLEDQLEGQFSPVDLIVSHYWDGAKLGIEFNKTLSQPAPHIWIPHSLGVIKQGNLPPEQWKGLRLTERISIEKKLVKELDGIGSTSALITQKLLEEYEYTGKLYFLPPCVDQDRYHAREVPADHHLWEFLSQQSGLSSEHIQERQIVTEISRTAITKRKDVLIKAFARAHMQVPDSFLVVAIDQKEEEIADELINLIRDLGLAGQVAVVGSIWDLLPTLYAVTDIYCTPAIVEGFGMSAQEAAATSVAVVASNRVPFVTEFLLGDDPKIVPPEMDNQPIRLGEGAIVVEADDIHGFAQALVLLLSDRELRDKIGQNAYKATVPYFTWDNMVARFLKELDLHA